MTTVDAIRRAAEHLAPQPSEFTRRHFDHPARFMRECVRWPAGESPTAYQLLLGDRLEKEHRLAVRSPHGAGKTALAALSVLWFALTREAAGIDWKVVTTASAWRQLTRYLWPEIYLWSRRLDWQRIGREPFTAKEAQTLALVLQHGSAFAAASDDPSLIEGAHATQLFYVFDESKSISSAIFDAAEGAFSTAGSDTESEAFALAISTPGEPSGRFYAIHRQEPGLESWSTYHVTLAQAIEAGRISEEWANERRVQWGATSPLYLNRVEGQFAESGTDSVIPLAHVEAAMERWRELHDGCSPEPGGHGSGCISSTEGAVIGADVGRGGDQTVLAVRIGRDVVEIRRSGSADLMDTTGRVRNAMDGWGANAVVDVNGIGAGVVDRLREQVGRARVSAFNASARSTRKDSSGELGFLNMRSDAWWTMRELLDPSNPEPIALPPDDRLLADLAAPTWSVTSAGRIQIEGKDAIRKRLGRSTDTGDAVVMTFRPNRARRTLRARSSSRRHRR